MKEEKKILSFHIGRGGRFNNQGHLSFIGERDINSFVDDLFTRTIEHEELSNYISEHPEKEDAIYSAITDMDTELIFKLTGIKVSAFEYYADNGESVLLNVDNDGTGIIDIDGDYNTTYSVFLEDISEREFDAIVNSTEWNKDELIELIEKELF